MDVSIGKSLILVAICLSLSSIALNSRSASLSAKDCFPPPDKLYPFACETNLFGESRGNGNQTLRLTAATGKTFDLSTQTSEFKPGLSNQGFWTGNGSGGFEDNYFTGSGGGSVTNSFFTFDLTPLHNMSVTTATLRLQRFGTTGNSGETYPFTLWDVSTPADVLSHEIDCCVELSLTDPIFKDLGSGKNYGAYEVSVSGDPNEILEFPLNSTASVDINRDILSGMQFFSIGGSLTLIPEPSSLTMMGLAALALAGAALRKSHLRTG